MKKFWKVLLYVFGAIVLLFIFEVVRITWGVQHPVSYQQQEVALGNSGTSYVFSDDGSSVITTPASDLISFEVNGSEQPIKVTSPASFALTWKLDPSLQTSLCSLHGTTNSPWIEGTPHYTNNPPLTATGTLKFENVLPSIKLGGTGSEAPSATVEQATAELSVVYNGTTLPPIPPNNNDHSVFLFQRGENRLMLECLSGSGSNFHIYNRTVDIWIN